MDLRNIRKDFPGEQEKKNHLEVVAALGKIGDNVEKVLSILQKQGQSQSEFITLVPQSLVPFYSNGYRFNSVIVGDSQASDNLKLSITAYGVTYTKTLSAGENEVNIPDGAQITVSNTSGNAAPLVINRYNVNRV